ncbi:glycosyltransferase [Thermodesulfobacteriota bacterium]
MKRVLLITSVFPPEGGGGIRRVYAYAKYLPENGWEPVVLTPLRQHLNFPEYGYGITCGNLCDVERPRWLDIQSLIYRLEENLPSGRPAGPTDTLSPFIKPHKTGLYAWVRKWFLVPDEFVSWLLTALKRGRKMIKELNVNAIISIGPSHSTHLLAYNFAKKSHIPWIADFKDPWTTNCFLKFPSSFHRAINCTLEKKVLEKCTMALTVSQAIGQDLMKINPRLHMEVLPNGFDPENFSGLQDCRRHGIPLRVIHAGALYGKRTPRPFLEALCYLRDRGITHQEVKVTFLGAAEQATRKAVEFFELADFVNIQGHVPHNKAIDALNAHDIYLLLPGPGKGTITGKIFEYLAFKRPILCVGGMGGDLESLLLEVGANYPYNENDTEGIGKKLFSWVQQKKKGELIECRMDQSRLSVFDRKEQVNRLAGWLNNLCTN